MSSCVVVQEKQRFQTNTASIQQQSESRKFNDTAAVTWNHQVTAGDAAEHHRHRVWSETGWVTTLKLKKKEHGWFPAAETTCRKFLSPVQLWTCGSSVSSGSNKIPSRSTDLILFSFQVRKERRVTWASVKAKRPNQMLPSTQWALPNSCRQNCGKAAKTTLRPEQWAFRNNKTAQINVPPSALLLSTHYFF